MGIPNLADDQTIPFLVEKKLKKKNFECYNFGLISAKISSEFNLIYQILFEEKPKLVVIYNGYNDINAGYLGQKFGYYEDINIIYKRSFLYDYFKNSPLFFLYVFFEILIKNLKLFISFNKETPTRMRHLRRQEIRKNLKHSQYEFNIKNYINNLKFIFYYLRHLNIPVIFIHQPCLWTTGKTLSDYENAYFFDQSNGDFYSIRGPELGLFKNSSFHSDRKEFIFWYLKARNLSASLCKINRNSKNDKFFSLRKLGVGEGTDYKNKKKNIFDNVFFLDVDVQINKMKKEETAFYDSVHITEEASLVISEEITKKVKKIFSYKF